MKLAFDLPSALDEYPTIQMRFQEASSLVVFLDYDGTLTPIVSNPEDADLSDTMRAQIKSLASHYPVAVISGRALEDVKKRVGIEELYYAGSHGFEISGPGGLEKVMEKAKELIPVFNKAEEEIKKAISSYSGGHVETKPFALAIHFRNVLKEKKEELIHSVEEVCRNYDRLKLSRGKEVLNVGPDLDWDKGKAMRWLLEKMQLKNPVFSIYIGDDTTDEDAFKILKENGIGILVREENHKTHAEYALNSPTEVGTFLQKLEK